MSLQRGVADSKRHLFIDGLRGLAIINMVAFHFLYDVNVVYGQDPYWPWRLGTHIWQQYICCSFILISGFVFSLGGGVKRNLRRGIIINLYGLLITLVTVLFMPQESIFFGILNLIGCSIILTCILDNCLNKLPAKVGAIISIALFILLKHLPEGYIGLGSIRLGSWPVELYFSKALAPLGLPDPGFVSGDYFPILPWFFLYLAGYYLWRILSDKPSYTNIRYIRIPFLSYIGSKSIWIYLAHQPLCMLVCMLIFR